MGNGTPTGYTSRKPGKDKKFTSLKGTELGRQKI